MFEDVCLNFVLMPGINFVVDAAWDVYNKYLTGAVF